MRQYGAARLGRLDRSLMIAPSMTTPATLRTAASSLSLCEAPGAAAAPLVVSVAMGPPCGGCAGSVCRDYCLARRAFPVRRAGVRCLAILPGLSQGSPLGEHGRLPERPMGADCKSVAKASKVRILHLPPPAETAPDLQRCSSGAVAVCPIINGLDRPSTGVRGEYAEKFEALRRRRCGASPRSCGWPVPPAHRGTWRTRAGGRRRCGRPTRLPGMVRRRR